MPKNTEISSSMKGPLGLAQRENDRRKERGIWAGALEENRGPHLTAVLLNRRIAGLYRVPDSRPEAVPCAALAFPSLRRFLTRRTCLLAPGEKFRRTQAHVPLGTRLRRMAGPKGK